MGWLRDEAIHLAEQGRIPDILMRAGIRVLLGRLLATLPVHDCEAAARQQREFIAMLDASPIAAVPEQANAQHYELPAGFFDLVLGPRRKYSCCHWSPGVRTLAEAEEASLALTLERAGIRDGHQVLELGCGWGSFCLYLAEHMPRCRVTAVSNSSGQRRFIESERERLGLDNLVVLTADMNTFVAPERYDRIVSLEMFEHMRNQRRLLWRIYEWLKPRGQLFVHVFCHRTHGYPFDDQGQDDWMSRYFFAGGIMPSDDLFLHFQDDLRVVDHWRWNGCHYARTLDAWLARMDAQRDDVWSILEATYGPSRAPLWWQRWRLFFLACSELFGYRNGQEWFISHTLFERPMAD